MSEAEELTGKAGIEASHGISPAPISPEPAEPATYGAGIEGVREAANDLSRERPAPGSEEPIKRTLEWRTGTKAGQTVDLQKEGFSLTAESAAKTLSEVHRTEDAMQAYENLQALAADVDATRAWAAGAEQQQPEQQQAAPAEAPQAQAEGPQPESTEQPSGLSPKLQQALQDPELRAAFEAPYQAAEQSRQAYTAAVSQVADVALSSVLANFPELQGVSGAQLPTVLAFIQKQDPVKAQAIQNQLQQVNAVYSAAQQAKAEQAQRAYAEFTQYAKQQDAAFENATRYESPETIRAAAKEIVDFAKSSGIPEETMAQLWATQPVLRSAPFQQLMLDAAKYRMAQRTATANPASRGNIPPVQRPGIAPSAGERSNVDLSELRNEFKRASGNDQIRAAVKLQQAQRRARS